MTDRIESGDLFRKGEEELRRAMEQLSLSAHLPEIEAARATLDEAYKLHEEFTASAALEFANIEALNVAGELSARFHDLGGISATLAEEHRLYKEVMAQAARDMAHIEDAHKEASMVSQTMIDSIREQQALAAQDAEKYKSIQAQVVADMATIDLYREQANLVSRDMARIGSMRPASLQHNSNIRSPQDELRISIDRLTKEIHQQNENFSRLHGPANSADDTIEGEN